MQGQDVRKSIFGGRTSIQSSREKVSSYFEGRNDLIDINSPKNKNTEAVNFNDIITERNNLNVIIEEEKERHKYKLHKEINPFFKQINKQNKQYDIEKFAINKENLNKL